MSITVISIIRTRLLQVFFLALTLSLALGINYISAWTGPTNAAPDGNAPAPINVSTAPQVKLASLAVGKTAPTASDYGLISYGRIRSTIGGVEFPDGSVQTTAGGGGGLSTEDFMHVQDQKPSGTHGQSLAITIWNIRHLNTVVANTISGASLAANQITLPAGTYYFEAASSNFHNSHSKLSLYNVTTATHMLIGAASYGDITGDGYVTSLVSGVITTTATNVFELRNRVGTAAQGGTTSGWGMTEVYSDIKIWKTK